MARYNLPGVIIGLISVLVGVCTLIGVHGLWAGPQAIVFGLLGLFITIGFLLVLVVAPVQTLITTALSVAASYLLLLVMTGHGFYLPGLDGELLGDSFPADPYFWGTFYLTGGLVLCVAAIRDN